MDETQTESLEASASPDGTAAAGQNDESRQPEQPGGAGEAQNRPEEEPSAEDPDTQPISKWEDVDLGLPEDARFSPELLADFGRQAVELGLSPKQARALAQWEHQAGQAMRRQLLEEGTAQLKKAWGNNYEARRQAALTLISQLDRELGGEAFSRALNASGAALHAPIVLGLAHLAGRLSEDSMGKSQPEGASSHETALEGLQNALAEARRK